MLPGLMQAVQLEMRLILLRARELHPKKTVTTKTAAGFRTTAYAEVLRRAGRLAAALRDDLGIGRGDRLGTLAWNSQQHLEIALAVPGMGAVLHTVNARLDPSTIGALIAEAGDRVVFVDASLLPLWYQVRVPSCVRAVVVIDDVGIGGHPSDKASQGELAWLSYEQVLQAPSHPLEWPRLDENLAAGLCFTSGTTGRPKGVVYSHRSTVLHSLSILLADGIALRERDVCLPVVQQFHANGWGFPYAAMLAGASLAYAGKSSDPDTLASVIEEAGVTLATAVPTVWSGLLEAIQSGRLERHRLATLQRLPVGGAVASERLIDGYAAIGIRVQHCWGMTEISPLGFFGAERRAEEHHG